MCPGDWAGPNSLCCCGIAWWTPRKRRPRSKKPARDNCRPGWKVPTETRFCSSPTGGSGGTARRGRTVDRVVVAGGASARTSFQRRARDAERRDRSARAGGRHWRCRLVAVRRRSCRARTWRRSIGRRAADTPVPGYATALPGHAHRQILGVRGCPDRHRRAGVRSARPREADRRRLCAGVRL